MCQLPNFSTAFFSAPVPVSMQSQLPFMYWSSITLKSMPAFLAEVECLKHKCGHIPGASVLRDHCMLPAAGVWGGRGAWQLCKASGRQCSSSLCVEYYSPCEVLLCRRLLWVIAKLGSLLRDTRAEWEDYVVLLHRGCTPLCLFLFCGYVPSSWTACVHKIFLPFCLSWLCGASTVLRSETLPESFHAKRTQIQKSQLSRLVQKRKKITILKE